MATALRGGACPQLKRLDLVECEFPEGVAVELLEALRTAPCRETLHHLGFDAWAAGPEGMQALGAALCSGALPRLERLDLAGEEYSWQDLEPFMAALVDAARAGKPCRLKDLEFYSSFGLDGLDLARVAEAAVKTGCPELTDLYYKGPVTREGALALVGAMRSLEVRAKLKVIMLDSNVEVEEEAMRILEEAGRDPSICPKLCSFAIIRPWMYKDLLRTRGEDKDEDEDSYESKDSYESEGEDEENEEEDEDSNEDEGKDEASEEGA